MKNSGNEGVKYIIPILRALLEMNDRVNAKRAKEITRLPANVIPMEQRGG